MTAPQRNQASPATNPAVYDNDGNMLGRYAVISSDAIASLTGMERYCRNEDSAIAPIYCVQFFGTTGGNGGNFLASVPPSGF